MKKMMNVVKVVMFALVAVMCFGNVKAEAAEKFEHGKYGTKSSLDEDYFQGKDYTYSSKFLDGTAKYIIWYEGPIAEDSYKEFSYIVDKYEDGLFMSEHESSIAYYNETSTKIGREVGVIKVTEELIKSSNYNEALSEEFSYIPVEIVKGKTMIVSDQVITDYNYARKSTIGGIISVKVKGKTVTLTNNYNGAYVKLTAGKKTAKIYNADKELVSKVKLSATPIKKEYVIPNGMCQVDIDTIPKKYKNEYWNSSYYAPLNCYNIYYPIEALQYIAELSQVSSEVLSSNEGLSVEYPTIFYYNGDKSNKVYTKINSEVIGMYAANPEKTGFIKHNNVKSLMTAATDRVVKSMFALNLLNDEFWHDITLESIENEDKVFAIFNFMQWCNANLKVDYDASYNNPDWVFEKHVCDCDSSVRGIKDFSKYVLGVDNVYLINGGVRHACWLMVVDDMLITGNGFSLWGNNVQGANITLADPEWAEDSFATWTDADEIFVGVELVGTNQVYVYAKDYVRTFANVEDAFYSTVGTLIK